MSTVSMMSLTPIGNPESRPGRPARVLASEARACARAGAATSARGGAGSWQGQDRVEAARPFLCRRAHGFGAAPGGAEVIEVELAAIGDLALVEQIRAQQCLVAVQFRGVHPRRLEGA